MWAVFAVSFGSPLLAFLGVLVGLWMGRKSARELEARSRREEMMRTLRWAAELAVADDDAISSLGVAQLVALAESELLDEAQQVFVDAALDAVVDDAVEEVDHAEREAEVMRHLEPREQDHGAERDVGLTPEARTEETRG